MIYRKFGKRLLDICISLIALIVLSPLLIIVGLYIGFSDGFPIIFKQTRMGKEGKCFEIYKFRTMVKNASNLGPLYTLPGDPRVTKIGFILRKTSIDELPQLINVLKGNMSIIGPRPLIPVNYEDADWSQKKRLSIKPGLACLVDIRGRSSVKAEQKKAYDTEYVDNVSLKLDILIIVGVIKVVLKQENVNSALKL